MNPNKVTISDSLFTPYARSMRLGQGNAGISPTHFEWELADPQTARFVTDPNLKHARGHGQVALLLESFFLHPEDYLTAMEKPFDYVLTHNSYFAQHKDWLWYPSGGSFVDFKNWGIHEKTKDVSILLSPKNQIWGHKRFHEIVQRFGDRIDVFGLDRYVDKMEAIAPYRFTIVVEGESTRDYFAEKLIDCFALGTVPIYWGCPNIGDFFDIKGTLLPRNLEEVGMCIEWATDYTYNMREAYIRANLETAKQYRIPEDWIYEHYPFLFEAQ